MLPGQIELDVIGVMGENVQIQHHVQQGDSPHYEVPANVKEFQLPPLELVLTKSFPHDPFYQQDRLPGDQTVRVSVGDSSHGNAQSERVTSAKLVKAEIAQASSPIIPVPQSALAVPVAANPVGMESEKAKPTEAPHLRQTGRRSASESSIRRVSRSRMQLSMPASGPKKKASRQTTTTRPTRRASPR